MTAEESNADLAMVQKHVAELGEHFESVQIFVTRHEPVGADDGGGTVNVNYGSGNWFARYGQVRNWVLKTDTRTGEAIRRENDD